MKLVTELKENEVIHCKTEEEAVAICKLMHEAGLKWSSGLSYLRTPYYVKDVCYCLKCGTVTCYDGSAYAIHPASDFFPAIVSLTHTIGEYVAAQHDGKLYLFKGNQSMVLTKDIINHIKSM